MVHFFLIMDREPDNDRDDRDGGQKPEEQVYGWDAEEPGGAEDDKGGHG